MTVLFDVFQKEPSGSVLWRGAAATLEEATARVRKFAINAPGEYVILNVRTGNKLVINCHGPNAPSAL